jgi:hypothetical protein
MQLCSRIIVWSSCWGDSVARILVFSESLAEVEMSGNTTCRLFDSTPGGSSLELASEIVVLLLAS